MRQDRRDVTGIGRAVVDAVADELAAVGVGDGQAHAAAARGGGYVGQVQGQCAAGIGGDRQGALLAAGDVDCSGIAIAAAAGAGVRHGGG